MKKLFILLIGLILLVGCAKKESIKEETTKPISQIEAVIQDDNYLIVDVRTKEEYNKSHLKNALNIPYDSIDEYVDLDKDKTILVYCASGKRSSIAYQVLTNLGYQVFDLGSIENITEFEIEKGE